MDPATSQHDSLGHRWLPIVRLLSHYRREWFRNDCIAGLSVCVVLIPSVIAYASLAGLAPVHGLYAALIGMVTYALFASSRQMVVGPDAALTILVAGVIGPLAAGDAIRAAGLAACLAILAGALMLLAAFAKLGVVVDFLSKPVLVGYMNGAALILLGSQLGHLVGTTIEEEDFFPRIWNYWARSIRSTYGCLWQARRLWRCLSR